LHARPACRSVQRAELQFRLRFDIDSGAWRHSARACVQRAGNRTGTAAERRELGDSVSSAIVMRSPGSAALQWR
jgi:hypothetical protein